MRLKSIKLAGFKSFVDATTVPFSTNMTAIVGPNGCGKSNIIDAVRWVMGESSAKNLRGESMTDVIFNGSTGRQPVGQASIELLFDNSDDRLKGEYAAFNEISIRRKVTREGVSQYYLNGSKCRRRDVTDIFLGTGMGPRSYAIIEQGMISKLIESKPEDLRVYLEEAAGISKYKERRRETENRMRRTQDNLDRLSDIRDELGKQLQHLKRQANAAERYAEYKKEERLNTAKLNAINWQFLSETLTHKQGLIREHEVKIEDTLLSKNTNENLLDTLRTRIEDAQENFHKIQAKYYQSGTEIATLEQQIQFQKNRLNEQQNTLQQLNEEIEGLTFSISEEKHALEDIDIELESILIEIEESEAKLEELSVLLEASSRELDEWQEAWEQFNHDNAAIRQSAEVAQSKIQEQENRLRDLSLKNEKLRLEQQTLHAQIEEVDLDELQEESIILNEQIETTSLKVAELEPQIEAKILEIETLKHKKSDIYKTVTEEKAVLASLNTLQQGALGDNQENIDHWIKTQGFTDLPKFIDSLNVTAGWEQAIELVLKDWLDTLVIDNSNLNNAVLIKSVCESNLAINLISDVQTKIKETAENKLIAVVQGANNLSVVLENIFIADSIDQALEIRESLKPHESVITQDGLWLSKLWTRHHVPVEEKSGMLVRAKRIKSLEESVLQLEKSYISIESTIDEKTEQLSKFEEDHKSLKQLLSTQEADLRKLDQNLFANQSKLDQIQLRLQRTEEDLSELVFSKEDISLNLEESRAVWQESMSKLETFAEQRDLLLEKKELVLTKLEQIRNQLRDAQNSAHSKQLTRQQKQSQHSILNQSIQRLGLELEQRKQKINQIKSNDSVDDSVIEDLSLRLEGLLETRLMTEEKLSSARKEVEAFQENLREEELKRNSFESHISAAREALASLRMEAQALSINQKNIIDKIEADDFDLDAIIEQLSEEDSESVLTESLSQLESKISRLGSINLAAIEEYQIQNERKAHLDEQNEDLTDALETLMAAIKKIDKETRTRFKETYDQVNEGLQRLFPKIFGGGNAYLELTDDNLLETGVQIIARPPGKKNATIHLLSGGEKSLTAIALIFAIFELNPAPFCMLDEVDAPLDDANVGRFANIVKEMSSQVQFIYISHNKVSMERADQLMGVTMHEPGVSRLVSVDIEQAAAMVETA